MQSRVQDVMTTDLATVPEGAGFKEIVATMRQRRVSAFPVLDPDGHVIGVVSEADLLMKEVGPDSARSLIATGRRGQRAKAAGATAAELMNSPAVVTSPECSVADAAKLMRGHRVKRLPVVDGAGRLVGIVSRIDLLSVYERPDGEIRDEVLRYAARRASAIDADSLAVTVTSGIVTVSGRAASRAAAYELVEAVRRAEGVVDVRDRISYPPPPG